MVVEADGGIGHFELFCCVDGEIVNVVSDGIDLRKE